MSFKLALLCVAVALCCHANLSLAIELVEMTDANKALLPLDLSKAFIAVQKAYGSEFDFKSVQEVRKFSADCATANDIIKHSSDNDYQGLAKLIKDVLAEPSIVAACSVSSQDISEGGFDALDTDFQASECDYLSVLKTDKLAEMANKVENSPGLSVALGKLMSKRIDELAEALLADAAHSVNIFFDNKIKQGMFSFNTFQYKDTCQIDLIKPICKLVRRTDDDQATAIAADVSDFIDLVHSGDQAKLAQFEEASGVTMSNLKENCANMGTGRTRFLKPIDQIEKWIGEGLMSSQQFEERLKADRELAFYNELNKLCKLSA